MKKILVIGSVYTEIITKVKTLPKGNEEFDILSSEETLAGDGYRVVRFLRGIDCECDFIASVGSGVYADKIIDTCNDEGISLSEQNEELNGCTLHLIAEDGQETFMANPGEEFEFHIENVYDVYPDEYECVIVTDEVLTTENIDDLLYTLEDMELPIYVYTTGKFADVEETVKENLFALSPTLFISDTDLYEFHRYTSDELKHAAESLYKKTNTAVYIFQKEVGVYCFDGEELFVAPYTDESNMIMTMSSFIVCRTLGIDNKNALMYATNIVNFTSYGDIKKSLAQMIVNV